MTNSDWWDRAKLPPRPQPIEIRKRELLATLRKGDHAPRWRPASSMVSGISAVTEPQEKTALDGSADGNYRRASVFPVRYASVSRLSKR
jgi:hypothetical protein